MEESQFNLRDLFILLNMKDMKKEEFRDGIEIVGATKFMADINDAQITFSF